LSLGLLVAVVVTGCGSGSDTNPDTELFWPLAVGNVWHYNFTEFTGGAAVSATARPTRLRPPPARPMGVSLQDVTAEDVWTVTGTEQIGGSTWYALVAQYVGGLPSKPRYLRHASQGLLIKTSLNDDGYYALRTPLEVGNSWQDPFDARVTLTIVSVTDTTTVPAGTFTNCIVVEDVLSLPGDDDVIVSWYAAGVGLVREEHWLGSTLLSELVLLSATLS